MDPEYLGIMLAVLCTETERKKKKKRLWTRSWVENAGRCCHISTKVVSIILLHFLSFSLLEFFLLLITLIFAVVTPTQRTAVKSVGKHCAWAPAVRGLPSRNWGRGSLMSTMYTSCDSPKNSDMPIFSSWGFRTSQTKASQIASMSHYKTSSRRRPVKTRVRFANLSATKESGQNRAEIV